MFKTLMIIGALFACVDLKPLQNVVIQMQSMERTIHGQWKIANRRTNASSKRNKTIKINKKMQFQTEHWSNCQYVTIKCRNGMDLGIEDDRIVAVERSAESIDHLFEIQSYGTSIIMLKHEKTNHYISMNAKGHLVARPDKSEENLFYQYYEENKYFTYASVKYYLGNLYDMFIGIRKNGMSKKARNTAPDQKSSQFQIVPSGLLKKCKKR